MTQLADNLTQVAKRIASASLACQRSEPTLLAVSKARSSAEVRAAYALGVTRFGENYLQEALEKQGQLRDLDIEWHFIGPVQSNKTRAIAENFAWVHSVDRLKIAQKLNDYRDGRSPLNVCIQVNIDRAPTKSGVLPELVLELVTACLTLQNLCVRGLMAIPDPLENAEQQQLPFENLAKLLHSCRAEFPEAPLDTLSMGMSSDLEAAIAAGSTLVRVGTDIFGARPPRRQ